MTTTLAHRSLAQSTIGRDRTLSADIVHRRESLLRTAAFAAPQVLRRWRVSVGEIVDFARPSLNKPAARPQDWIEDLALAYACCRGDQAAWHHLELAHCWRLREAAALRVGTQEGLRVVAQFAAHLRRNTRAGAGDPSLTNYSGEVLLLHWLVARMHARLESPGATRVTVPTLSAPAANPVAPGRPDHPCDLDIAHSVRTLPRGVFGIARMPSAT